MERRSDEFRTVDTAVGEVTRATAIELGTARSFTDPSKRPGLSVREKKRGSTQWISYCGTLGGHRKAKYLGISGSCPCQR